MTIKYTYEEIDKLTLELFEQIKNDFKPDVIVGIVRGGLVPAVILSHLFNVPLRILNTSLRDFESSDSYDYSDEFNNILFIDDIVDSGATAHEIVEPYKNNNTYDRIRVASIFIRYTSNFNVDYYSHKIEGDDWIEFPWEHDTKED